MERAPTKYQTQRPKLAILGLFSAIALMGCLASTHHLNNGSTLTPGVWETSNSISMGKVGVCDSYGGLPVENGYHTCKPNPNDTDAYDPYWRTHVSTVTIPSYAYQWRLGVRDAWGPFTGVDMGYAQEFPRTWEFDMRFGLPSPLAKVDHSVATGWAMGLWPDNTWFVEYAVGKEFNGGTIYANSRFNWLATQMADMTVDEGGDEGWESNDIFAHQRRIVMQVNVGTRLDTPNDYWLLPDFWHFNYHIGWPNMLMDGSTDPNPGTDTRFIFAWGFHYKDD